jgi:hypothetical protein
MTSEAGVARELLSKVLRDMDDPNRGFTCMFAFIGHLAELLQASEANPSAWRERMDQYRTAAFRWLTAPRSSRQQQNLVNASCRCSAQLRNSDPAHVYGQAALARDKPFMAVLKIIIRTLIPALEDKISPGGVRIHRIGERRSWPRALQQLLPHGTENTIRAFIAWFRVVTSDRFAGFLGVFHLFLTYTYPLTIPYVVTSRALMVYGVLGSINSACRLTKEHPTDMFLQQSNLEVLALSGRIMSNVTLLWSSEVERRVFTEHSAIQLLVAYDRAIDACRFMSHLNLSEQGPDCQVVMSQFKLLGSAVIQDFNLLSSQDFQRAGLSPLKVVQRFMQDASTPWKEMIRTLHQNARAQVCASPDCRTTYAAPCTFKYCGGCRRAVYCSRKCQKRAWTHPVAPHGDVCALLKETCSANRLSGTNILKVLDKQHRNFVEDQGAKIVQHFARKSFHEVSNLRMSFLRVQMTIIC